MAITMKVTREHDHAGLAASAAEQLVHDFERGPECSVRDRVDHIRFPSAYRL
jgi:hypothetical protein